MNENNKKEQIDFKYNLNLYYKFLKKYKFLVFWLLLVILIIEATSVADKFLFKAIIDSGTEFSAGNILKEVFLKTILIVGVIYVSFVLVRAILKFIYLHLINILDAGMIFDLKQYFFSHLLTLDYEFHTNNKTGSLISKLLRIGGAVEKLTDVIIFNFAPLTFQLTVAFFSLLYFGVMPAVVTLITVILFVGYSLFMQRLQESANINSNETEDREKAVVSDIFTNIESVKYFGKEGLIKKKFKIMNLETKESALRFWGYFRWLDSIQLLILAGGIFFVIYFPLIEFINGKIPIGTVVFTYTVFTALVGSLFAFVWGIRNFYRAMADMQSIFQYAKIQNKIKDNSTAKELKLINGEIEFNDVSFSYGNRKIFDGFNLKIEKNKNVAFVGHSGSGKSTLVKLLFRLYDLNSGSILIDKQNINNVKQESLRESMAIVPQECILFDDTIFNNVAFSNPRASYKEVLNAIKFAQLDKIILNFPKKEKTIVGERGVKLSGGEKQRVSIARAILADKKILVLDEATSALDSQTEHDIQQDLKKLMKGRTTLIIAHRLSTIMNSDQIVVMDKGKIVQIGNHQELISQEGQYKKLWNLQKGGYIK